MHKYTVLALWVMLGGVSIVASAAESMFVVKSVEIHQPLEVVWSKVSNFGDLGAWHPAVAKTEILAGRSDRQGAQRVLTLQDGGKVYETLTAFDAKNKVYSYKITESVLPVDQYVSTVSVHPNGAGNAVVVWESHFLAKSPADEKTARETIKAVYEAGLNQLQKIFN